MKKIEMIVEIPKGSANKYEFNGSSQRWELDRVLYGSMSYPEEYGFIPETLDYDGDPLDVICLTNFPSFPSCTIPIRVLGVLKMIDQNEHDYKIIAVNGVDNRFSHIQSLADIGEGKLAEISNFFLRYKELEKKEVVLNGYGDKEDAIKVINKCKLLQEEYRNLFPKVHDKQNVSQFLSQKEKVNII